MKLNKLCFIAVLITILTSLSGCYLLAETDYYVEVKNCLEESVYIFDNEEYELAPGRTFYLASLTKNSFTNPDVYFNYCIKSVHDANKNETGRCNNTYSYTKQLDVNYSWEKVNLIISILPDGKFAIESSERKE